MKSDEAGRKGKGSAICHVLRLPEAVARGKTLCDGVRQGRQGKGSAICYVLQLPEVMSKQDYPSRTMGAIHQKYPVRRRVFLVQPCVMGSDKAG